jgi:orotidine-5'-phosphate decarboxylase
VEPLDPRTEASRLEQVFAGQPHLLVTFLGGQLAVVKNEAQVLLGLCGLAVTVTGFSGAHMIRAAPASALAMVGGIALILVAALLALRTLTQVRWVSQDLGGPLAETAEKVIVRRNAQQRRLGVAGVFVGAGLAAYLLAVSIAALAGGRG